MEKDVFNELNAVNVNEWVEKKSTGGTTLSYLSWANAWKEVKKRYPDANYEIVKFENGLPYCYDENTGYMVYTKVTIQGVTHEMWLCAMDSRNKALLSHPYEVKTKYSTFTVEKCTMFDINKTIMRCLTKNLAMFGLGLYLYAGEDIPQDEKEETKSSKQSAKTEEKPVPPSAEDLKKAENMKSTLLDYEDVIPKDKWTKIDEAVTQGNIAYLETILSWAKGKAEQKSA